jgi:CRP-like cAMP-binding protein
MSMSKQPSEDQTLSRLLRSLSAGEYLFQQGDMGATMFLILEGTVHLFRTTHQTQRLVWTLGPGEMLGEKAILTGSPYHRTSTAQASTKVTAFEFDAKNIKTIQTKFPDFMMKLTKMLSERLDHANELISILQSKEDPDRVIRYMLFFANAHASKTAEGLNVAITAEEIAHVVNVDINEVTRVLDEITSEKYLIKAEKGYVITDAKMLEASIPTISTKLAA